jgi:aspartate aminotransferase
MFNLSKRAINCKGSATLTITAKAATLKKEGYDVVNFGAGQPDFEPSENIIKSIEKSIYTKGNAKYTPASGLFELKQEIIKKFRIDNNIDYDVSNISINVGAKHSIYNILQAIVNPGDEVIVIKPYWVSYPEMIELAGGIPVYIECDDDFNIINNNIKKSISDKTKAIIINSPSNPSGATIDKSTLEEIGKLAVENKFYIISDEIYEKIKYSGKHESIASFSEELKQISFTINGMSKSHAIPGWRIGYIGGPSNAIKAINNIQSHSTSNPCSIIQYAAIDNLNNSNDFIEKSKKSFLERRDYIVNALNKIKGINCPMPSGAFYVFFKIPDLDDWEFCNKLLDTKFVAAVPGSEFGMNGYVRLSYATSLSDIKKGVERIKEFIEDNY